MTEAISAGARFVQQMEALHLFFIDALLQVPTRVVQNRPDFCIRTTVYEMHASVHMCLFNIWVICNTLNTQ